MPKCDFNKVANLLCFRLSGRFLGIASLVFSKYGMMLETYMKLRMRAGFSGKAFLPQKLEK